jgi:hypothetical protein
MNMMMVFGVLWKVSRESQLGIVVFLVFLVFLVFCVLFFSCFMVWRIAMTSLLEHAF